jgi:hypothetical protein
MSAVQSHTPNPIEQSQNGFSEYISTAQKEMSILGTKTFEKYSQEVFSQPSKLLPALARQMVLQCHDVNAMASDLATRSHMQDLFPDDPNYAMERELIADTMKAQSYCEASRKALADRFVASMPVGELEIFKQRIAKVCQETTFSKKGVEAQFSGQLLQRHPDNRMVTTAIEESSRASIVQFLYRTLQSKHEGVPLENVFQTLPEKDRLAIERLVSKYRKGESGDLARLFRDQNSDPVPLTKALQEYLERGPLGLVPNFSRSCDESLHPPFFKIKDREGKTRGYILGIYHRMPKEYCRLPRKLWHALFKSDLVAIEGCYTNAVLDRYQLEKSTTHLLNDHPFRKIECKLAHKSRVLGKPIIPLDTQLETKKLSEKLNRYKQPAVGEISGSSKQPLSDSELNERKFQRMCRNGERWKRGENDGFTLLCDFLCAVGHDEKEVKDILAAKNFKKLNQLFLDLPDRLKEQFKCIVTDRNVVFSDRIDSLLKSKSSQLIFAAFGKGHLLDIGDSTGVLALLKGKGWDLIPA